MGDSVGRDTGLDAISARDVVDAAPDALIVVDEAGEIVHANGLAEQMFGYPRQELHGRPIENLLPERFRESHANDRAACVRDPHGRAMGRASELRGLRKDGTEFAVEIDMSPLVTARGTLVLAAPRDLSARRQAEAEARYLERERALYAEISHLAQHDPLTGLPNRALLYDRLASAIASARRGGYQVAVLSVDLDRFKHVNDSFGHATGDRLLESVVARLSATVREIDTVSRQGGDEFVILLSEVHDRDEVARAAATIMAAVSGAHVVGRQELHVTPSIGIAVYPDAGGDADALIKNADVAMYHAKERGRANFQFFTPEMNRRVVERQAVEASLRHALERQEFLLFYQPKVNLQTGAMIGAEALLRWRHPDRGLLAPERFVAVAEDSGLIVPIGQWVLGEACRQARAWQAAGLRGVPVAVNVSGVEFRNDGFLDSVDRTLGETGLDPGLLEVELTESVLMESVAATSSVLGDLKRMGLRLAVDDFGTGYSSLSYLMQFPIDALKVDQSFVREITAQTDGAAIIKAVISMGRSLKHRVIAEGVETPEQLAFLQAEQCEEGQGFHFSRPLPAERFAQLLDPANGAP